MESSSAIEYLSSCNKVTLDAYNRVMERLQRISQSEELINEVLNKQIKEEEERERKIKEKQRRDALRVKSELEGQIREKQYRNSLERKEARETVTELPENVVTVFPKIVQTPPEMRKARKTKTQAEVRSELQAQIEIKKNRKEEEHKKEIEMDMERIQKIVELQKKEEIEDKLKMERKMKQYKETLLNDMERKEIKKANDKKLIEIEHQGMTTLQNILSDKIPEENLIEKTETPITIKEEMPPSVNMDKLVGFLEKKQRKAIELAEKLEALQKSKGLKLRNVVVPLGYKMKSEGKTVRLSSERLKELIEERAQRNKQRKALRRSQSIEKMAHDRYLSQLAEQTTEEHKRILETLRRERDSVERIKAKEKSLKEQRLLYRKLILDEIATKSDKKKAELEEKRRSPGPVFDLPKEPVKENNSEKLKSQKSVWIAQMQEKQAKHRKEREEEATKALELLAKTRQEEKAEKEETVARKKAENQKWKQTWEAEMQFRNLVLSIEGASNKSRCVRKQLILPKENAVFATIGCATTRAYSTLPAAKYESPQNMFVTALDEPKHKSGSTAATKKVVTRRKSQEH